MTSRKTGRTPKTTSRSTAATRKSVDLALTSPANHLQVAEGQRPCPICRTSMQSVRREDEQIDVCAEHGVWLDRFELERLFLKRARRRGAIWRRQVDEARAEGKWDWFFYGVLAAT